MEKFNYKFVAQEESSSADIYIYGVIGWDVRSIDVVKDIALFKGDTLNVHINSVGGMCDEGFAIFNAIKNFKGTTKAIIDGMAGSCASYIMLACETIVAEENSTIFIHNPLIEYASGNKNDLSKIVNELEKLEQIYVDAYVSKTGKDEETIRIAMDDETTFTSQEAKDFGLIDEVLIRSENQNEKASATKGFYRFVAQYFSQQKQTFKESESQEQNQQKGIEMEIKDAEGLIAVLTSLKDLNDVEEIKAELEKLIGAVENLEIKEKEAEPTEEEKPEETPETEPAKEEENVQAKIDEAVAKAKADIMAEAEARFNAMLLAKTDTKAVAKSHSEVYNSMVAGADKSAYFKAHKQDILLGK
jgi:ATP-dependent protease ClpP protease subunit